MQDVIQAIIHKASVTEICVTVNKTGLSMGDKVDLHLMEDGRVAVFGWVRRRVLFVPRLKHLKLGYLGPHASTLLEYGLRRGDYMRVRIVGLTPEHLATDGLAEIYVSVWGNIPDFRTAGKAATDWPVLTPTRAAPQADKAKSVHKTDPFTPPKGLGHT